MQKINECKICKSRKSILIKKFKIDTRNFNDFRGVIKDVCVETNLKLCIACGFMYYDNVPSLDELELIYKKENRNKVKKTFQKKILLERSFSFLKNKVNFNRKKIIDIGSGDFSLLDKLSEFSPSSEISAINISCSDDMHGKVKVYHTMLEKFETDEEYDLIILSHILEHIISLDEFFVQLEKVAHKETILYIEVPFQVGPGLFLNRSFHVQHINYFTPKSLANLLALKGYKIESCDFDQDGYFCYGVPGIIRAVFKKENKTFKTSNSTINTLYYLLSPYIYLKSSIKKIFYKQTKKNRYFPKIS